jgi:SAM-dependent methyltransferase
VRRLVRARELLDGTLDDPEVLDGNLRDLARVNRWLGGVRLSERAVEALAGAAADEGRTITLVDVGTGAADIPAELVARWRRRGRRLEAVGVESRAAIADAAGRINPGIRRSGVRIEVADGMALPFANGAFDIAHCSLVLHHLDAPAAIALLRELRRVARRGVVVNDLARGRWLWAGAWLLSRVATTNRFTRNDGPLSVRRAWTLKEARAMVAVAGLRPVAEVVGVFGHRWAIAARP